MRFSERFGFKKVNIEIQRNEVSKELRNSLWNVFLDLIIESLSNESPYSRYGHEYSQLTNYFRDLWINFYKRPIDTLQLYDGNVSSLDVQEVRDWFYKCQWHEVLDFIEFTSSYHTEFCEICNRFLSRELSAYRFIDKKLVEIDSKNEIKEIEESLKIPNKFQPVKTHLKAAISLLSNRNNPDYRNSIKESISAIESLAIIITGDDKATLGKSLKVIEKKYEIPNSLKSAFSTLYGYTSDQSGIRHALLSSDVPVTMSEAKFMLVVCSAFVNYLISKL